jgi:hypothetical protein
LTSREGETTEEEMWLGGRATGHQGIRVCYLVLYLSLSLTLAVPKQPMALKKRLDGVTTANTMGKDAAERKFNRGAYTAYYPA